MADELELDVNEKKGGKKILLIVVVLLVLLAGGGAAAWFFLSGAEEEAGSETDTASARSEVKEVQPALYMDMSPPFIVNFGPGSKVRYLQVEMQVMAREQGALDALVQHMPVVRNNVLVLLSSYSYEQLANREGKEKLRQEILTAIQKVIDEEGEGKAGTVQAVYFTGFIMQ